VSENVSTNFLNEEEKKEAKQHSRLSKADQEMKQTYQKSAN